MATYAAVFCPKSGSGAVSSSQNVSNLAAATASSNLTVGTNSKVAISVSYGTGTQTTNCGAAVRFSRGGSAATSADFIVPVGSTVTFDTGAEFDTVSFFNINAAAPTLNISVMQLGN